MKLIIALTLILSACGYSSKDNEAIGQVKKVSSETPLLCNDYSAVDISMGIMRNGVGSMSTEDLWFYVPSNADVADLKYAAETGKLVKITYDIKRVVLCVPDHIVTKIEIIK
jgi:major membrane immunogen (membrane-anchored lipoprotein)